MSINHGAPGDSRAVPAPQPRGRLYHRPPAQSSDPEHRHEGTLIGHRPDVGMGGAGERREARHHVNTKRDERALVAHLIKAGGWG